MATYEDLSQCFQERTYNTSHYTAACWEIEHQHKHHFYYLKATLINGGLNEMVSSNANTSILIQMSRRVQLITSHYLNQYWWRSTTLTIIIGPKWFKMVGTQLLEEQWQKHYVIHVCVWKSHGPLDRYAKLRVAHAPGMPGTFSPPPRVSDPDMHHGTCVTHVPWCRLGSLTSGFPLKSMAGKTFPAFPAHAQPEILRIW